jgi:hypothetical protein
MSAGPVGEAAAQEPAGPVAAGGGGEPPPGSATPPSDPRSPQAHSYWSRARERAEVGLLWVFSTVDLRWAGRRTACQSPSGSRALRFKQPVPSPHSPISSDRATRHCHVDHDS